MDLYPTIFTRHSVHSFDPAPLDRATLEAIVQAARQADHLTDQAARIEVASADQVKGSSAPHHLLAFTVQDDAGFADAGYVLQQADLAIQAQGLGSHWIGLAKPKVKAAGFTILLAFGRTDEGPRPAADFKRLALAEISDQAELSDQAGAVAEAVRLAPSGMNDQPWRLRFGEGLVSLIHTRRGPWSRLLVKKMDKVSLGIATRHAVIALEHEGRQVTSVSPVAGPDQFRIDVAYR
ncbi:MAG: hypothetical protein LBK54_06075 [Propionibacteriaceae bacterium]|jgi:nitroreductase|nr:hypothetical protein [Propionibacteriaceae bacterium]